MELIKKITSLVLVATILLSSLGFTANKMVCLKSGKTKFSLTHVKSCCKNKSDSKSTVKTNCCDIQNSYFSLDNFDVSKINTADHLEKGSLLIAHRFFGFDSPYHKVATPYYSDSSPPIAGRNLLSLISVLII